MAVGFVARLAPLGDQDGRLLRQFPSEDGYLMLTIARNIALGHGMSTAEGAIPTNGTQPLATYLWAGCFWLMDGARTSGVMLVSLVQLLIACGAAWLIYALGRQITADRPGGPSTAALAGAVWFASPLSVVHTMNCLETGLYVLVVLGVACAIFARPRANDDREQLGHWAWIGFLLGVAFLARNDAILLCAAIGFAHLCGLLPIWKGTLRQRIAQLASAAVVTLAVASPWLISNYLRFGHIVPVSGQAESLNVGIGHNLARIPGGLLEHLSVIGLIPSSLETHPVVVLVAAVVVIALTTSAVWLARAWSAPARSLFAAALLYTLFLSGFYGLFFGAGHFVSRYLFPASPFLVLALVIGLDSCWRRLPDAAHALGLITVLGGLILLVGLNTRVYVRGAHSEHFQVVEWVRENVPSETWVGAIQTGTLGFFHERTINLDGKVNPEALEARRHQGIPAYVLESEIEYLADWVGLASWAALPELRPHFELLVRDETSNLAVLRRRKDPASIDRGPTAG